MIIKAISESPILRVSNNPTLCLQDTFSDILELRRKLNEAIAEINTGSSSGVNSVFGRTGVVVAQANDYTWAQINKTTSSISDITSKSHSLLSNLNADDHSSIYANITSSKTITGQWKFANHLIGRIVFEKGIEFDSSYQHEIRFLGSAYGGYYFHFRHDPTSANLYIQGDRGGGLTIGSPSAKIATTINGNFSVAGATTIDLSGTGALDLPADAIDSIDEIADSILSSSTTTAKKLVTTTNATLTPNKFVTYDSYGDLLPSSYSGSSFKKFSATHTVTANATISEDYDIWIINLPGASGDVTLTLPQASSTTDGFMVKIKNLGVSGTKSAKVATNGSDTIDDSSSDKTLGVYGILSLVCDGSKWWTI